MATIANVAYGGSRGRHHLFGRPDRDHHGHPFIFGLALSPTHQGHYVMSEATIFVAESGARVSPGPGPVVQRANSSYVELKPAFAGAVVAAAAFFVLMAFASAIGLAVSSASPTWRDTSVGLTVLSGAWVVFSAVGSFALGGYIAGRLRARWDATADEIHFRDGVHGLLVWGLAVIIGVGMAWAAATTLTNRTTPSTVPRDTSANEPGFLTYELDRLFRSDRAPQGGDAEARAEAGRIVQTALGHTDIAPDDRAYLVRLVAARTGLPPTDADRRVQQIISESRDAAAKARRSAVILAFTLAAALVAAAGAAWATALAGGRHRDEDLAPSLHFSRW
jgi:hypothetical protein